MAADERKLNSSLYVGDLHPDVTEEDLNQTFSRVGPLLSVRLCRDRVSGRSLRYAYVNFWLPYHALVAIDSLNHTELKGKSMRIMFYEKDPIAKKGNNGNLFVKNLNKSISSFVLHKIFSEFGTILSCKVAEEDGVSKGFGFVQFESEISAIAARDALHDSLLGGKKLYVSKFLRKNERIEGEMGFNSLYVKNLDEGITDDALRAKFSRYGKVWNAAITKDQKGKSKGFGFVDFDSHEAAKRAMMFLNGKLLGSKNMVVVRALKEPEQSRNLTQISGYTDGDQIMETKASNALATNPISSLCAEIFGDNGTVNSARPMWSYAVSRRLSYTSFLYPYNTKKTFDSRNEVANTGGMVKPFEKLPPQPFYATKWQQQHLCNVSCFNSAAPTKQLSSFYPTTHNQYVATAPVASYPFKARYIQCTSAAFPKEATATNQCKYLEMAKDHKGSSPVTKNLKYLEMAKDHKGSSPITKNLRTVSSPFTIKTRKGCVLQPLPQNLQQPSLSQQPLPDTPKVS